MTGDHLDTAKNIAKQCGIRIPYLRVLSINGILICEVRMSEILSEIKIDSSNKILICGGQACVVMDTITEGMRT